MGKTQDRDRATFRVAEARLGRMISSARESAEAGMTALSVRIEALERPWWKRWLR